MGRRTARRGGNSLCQCGNGAVDGLGVQSFFYGVYSLTLVLLGVVVAVSRRFGAWIGSVAVAAGLVALAIGIDVACRGPETEFYERASVGYQLLVLVFVVGIFVAEVRPRTRPSIARTR